MNAKLWKTLSKANREAQTDYTGLTAQLLGLEGYRVEATAFDGQKRRFIVGRSTGWKPCHLELHNRRSMGGQPANVEYFAVTTLYNVRSAA